DHIITRVLQTVPLPQVSARPQGPQGPQQPVPAGAPVR
ncbi:ATPase, partial [Amycolatopsis magusensis]|nr:ATPase [Amycolatopsis magusensis]